MKWFSSLHGKFLLASLVALMSVTGILVTSTLFIQDFTRPALLCIGLVFIMMMVGILSLIFRYFVTRPLHIITTVMSDIANGNADLNNKIVITTNDEFGELADATNQLTKKIYRLMNYIVKNGEELTTASSKISSATTHTLTVVEQTIVSVNKIDTDAQQQAQGLANCSTAVHHMDQITTQVATEAQIVATMAQSGASTSLQSGDKIKAAIQNMLFVRQRVDESAVSFHRLTEQLAKVGGIVEVITGIAEQTGLLALNAAIEAARAGENGRGFAIVASEVKKLAEGSRLASAEITTLITGIQLETDKSLETMHNVIAEVETGADLAQHCGETLTTMEETLEQLVTRITSMSAKVQNVAGDMQQIVGLIQTATAISHQTTLTSQQLATDSQAVQISVSTEIKESATRVNDLAKDTEEMIAQFSSIMPEDRRRIEAKLAQAHNLLLSKGQLSLKDGQLLLGGQPLHENDTLVDDLSSKVDAEVTIFQENIRIATTVRRREGIRATGTKVAKYVADIVLTKNRSYTGRAKVVGRWFLVAYEPLHDDTGKTIGMMFVGEHLN